MANLDQDAIPALDLKTVIPGLQNMIGRSFTYNILSELAQAGVDLSNKSESYFLHEVRETLDFIFGRDAAEVLIENQRRLDCQIKSEIA